MSEALLRSGFPAVADGKRGEGQPGAVGAQAALKDSSAGSVCHHPSLIYYEKEGKALGFTFMLPQIWFSLNFR